MKDIWEVRFHAGSKEELLPDFDPAFPYIASRVELDRYPGRAAPWHWHGAVELAYTQAGCVRYHTPGGVTFCPAGSAALVNANVLHMTTAEPGTVQLLHIFDPSLLAPPESRVAQRYLAPLTTSQMELLALSPDDPCQARALEMVQTAFQLSPDEFGYELRLRNALGELWLALLELARPALDRADGRETPSNKVKEMMIYIHEHFGEKLSIADVAGAAFLSERACFRAFRACLHTTPTEYIKSYRLQQACRLLRQSDAPLTQIGQLCGLGSSSYFGKTFRDTMGCTPSQYRHRWRNIDN